MSTNTPKVGEDARGVTCANPQCEDGTVWVENGFGARYLCSDCHATDTEQPPTLNQLETGVESSPATGTEQDMGTGESANGGSVSDQSNAALITKLREWIGARRLGSPHHPGVAATLDRLSALLDEHEKGAVESSPGTEQDIPAASEWPDEDLISAAMRVHNATADRTGSNAFANRPGMRAALGVALAEHDRWVAKLRGWIARERAFVDATASEYELAHDEGYDQCLMDLEALLAEAKATEPPGRSIFEEPACTPYPRPDDVVAKATDAAAERRKEASDG
jgi:hypothetical protein